ncbi:MAG: response regulator [Syntrophomonadaceae bacterium]|nr:response regulator [Syntrophomonadaceae bacterium]
MTRLCIISPVAITKQNLKAVLSTTQYKCEYLDTLADYYDLEETDTSPFNVFIIDFTMNENDLFDFLRHVRSKTAKTPVMVLSPVSDRNTIVQVLRQGADDYVLKPFEAGNLLDRLDRIINLYVPDIARMFPQSLVLDLGSVVELELARARRHNYSFSFVRLFFTLIESKDQKPHQELLVNLMQRVFIMLKSQYRKTDLVLAAGGDSFVISLPFTDKEGALTVIRRMIATFEQLKAKFPPQLYFVEIGYASYPDDAADAADLINYVAREKKPISYYKE